MSKADRIEVKTDVRVTALAPYHVGKVGKVDMYGTGPSEGVVVINLGNGTYIAVDEKHIQPLRE